MTIKQSLQMIAKAPIVLHVNCWSCKAEGRPHKICIRYTDIPSKREVIARLNRMGWYCLCGVWSCAKEPPKL